VEVAQEARVAEKQVEQVERAKVVAPNVAPNTSPHSAFQFSALCSRKIEVYILDKCISGKIHQIIKPTNDYGILHTEISRTIYLDDES
jgi:hypothetical protein